MIRPVILFISMVFLPSAYPAEIQTPKPTLAHPIPSVSEKKGDKVVGRLSLEKSIAYALQATTSVIKARGEMDVSAQQLLQGYFQFLPNLTATASYNKSRGKSYLYSATPTTVDSINSGAGYSVSTTINIFNGLSDLANLKSSIDRRDAANWTLKRAKQQIALDVAQSFLQVILDAQIVRIAEKNLVSSQEREKLLAAQTKVGVRNLADLFRQQAQTSSDEAFLVTSQNKERSDELQLLAKLRLDPAENYQLLAPHLEESPKENQFDDEDKLIKTALANRPDLMAAESTAAAASWDVTAARSPYFPKFDFGASVSGAGRTLNEQLVNGADQMPADQIGLSDQLRHQVIYYYGITMTWSIFDRWTTRMNTERAHVNAANAKLDSEDRRNQVVAEVRQAFGDYRAILQELESTKKGLQAAEKAFEVMQGRYQVGSASFVDLTTAQAALVQAQASRAQAIIAFSLEKRALETALGTTAVE